MSPLHIAFGDQQVPFTFWSPDCGVQFSSAIAIDTETTLVESAQNWKTPTLVIAAATDGQKGVFIPRALVIEFLVTHQHCAWIFHSAAFDLAVTHKLSPNFDIYRQVDRGLVFDTQLEHKLLCLATEGHTADRKGQSTLDTCAERYLGVTLEKDVEDQGGNQVRLNFGAYLGLDPTTIPPQYLEYLGRDVLATLAVHHEVTRRTRAVLENFVGVWGYVDGPWLADCGKKWGLLTHQIQLQSSIVLRETTAAGLHINLAEQKVLVETLAAKVNALRESLRKAGYLVGQPGSGKALQGILKRLQRQHPHYLIPLTESGKDLQSRADALEPLAEVEPFIRDLLDYKTCAKLATTFATKLSRPRIHPSFGTLKRTGRTSSFGELNAQNLPRDKEIRNCFAPTPGFAYVVADYKMIELVCLASAAERQFGLSSKMKQAINAGDDLHRLVAAAFFGKPVTEVTAEERRKAKAINFGKPGGMGNRTLQSYARTTYQVPLTEEEVTALSDSWLDRFPEMRDYLRGDDSWLEKMVIELGLNWADYNTAQGKLVSRWRTAESGDVTSTIPLAQMLLKAMREEQPTKGTGEPYSPAELDYLWERIMSFADRLPKKTAAQIRNRKPSEKLRNEVRRFFDKAPVFTLSGRLRAEASYSARHNTVFQGLAADGAKLAMWKLWRAGYRIVNFIHDEFLIEVPADSDLHTHNERVKQLMIEGMAEVIPDVLIDVESVVTTRWVKEAQPTFDSNGRMIAWTPSEPTLAKAG